MTIVFGTNSRKSREKLINEGKELTLDRAVDIAPTHEMSQSQMKSMEAGDEAVHTVNREKIPHGHQRSRHSEVHVVDAGRPTQRIHVQPWGKGA